MLIALVLYLICDNRIVMPDVTMFCFSAYRLFQNQDIACRGKITLFTNRSYFNATTSTYRKTDKNKKYVVRA